MVKNAKLVIRVKWLSVMLTEITRCEYLNGGGNKKKIEMWMVQLTIGAERQVQWNVLKLVDVDVWNGDTR